MLVLLPIFQNLDQPQILKKINNNDQGSTLLELLLALAIGSIIVLSLYSVLNFTNNIYKRGSMEDEILLNGRYALEYIKRDIKSADKIIDINKIRINELDKNFHNNVGFIVMKNNPNSKESYKYSTYYLKDDKLIYVANNREGNIYPPSSAFGGHNLVSEYIISIDDTYINWEKKLIKISLDLGEKNGKETKLETKLKIRCPVDY